MIIKCKDPGHKMGSSPPLHLLYCFQPLGRLWSHCAATFHSEPSFLRLQFIIDHSHLFTINNFIINLFSPNWYRKVGVNLIYQTGAQNQEQPWRGRSGYRNHLGPEQRTDPRPEVPETESPGFPFIKAKTGEMYLRLFIAAKCVKNQNRPPFYILWNVPRWRLACHWCLWPTPQWKVEAQGGLQLRQGVSKGGLEALMFEPPSCCLQ